MKRLLLIEVAVFILFEFMKGIVFFILTMLVPAASFCQDSNWSLSLSASPVFFDLENPGLFEGSGKSSGYSLALEVNRKIGERFSVSTGLHNMSMVYTYSFDFNFLESDDPLIPKVSEDNTQSLVIPIHLSYDILKADKFCVFGSLGVNYAIQVSSKNIFTFQDNHDVKTDRELENSLLAEFRLGCSYAVSEHLNIFVAPSLSVLNNDFGFSKKNKGLVFMPLVGFTWLI